MIVNGIVKVFAYYNKNLPLNDTIPVVLNQ